MEAVGTVSFSNGSLSTVTKIHNNQLCTVGKLTKQMQKSSTAFRPEHLDDGLDGVYCWMMTCVEQRFVNTLACTSGFVFILISKTVDTKRHFGSNGILVAHPFGIIRSLLGVLRVRTVSLYVNLDGQP